MDYKKIRKIGKSIYLSEVSGEAKRLWRDIPNSSELVGVSREIMKSLPRELLNEARKAYKDPFPGHGYRHAYKIAFLSAGIAYHYASEKGLGEKRARRLAREAAVAGLLHDVARKEQPHAKIGAERARKILTKLGLDKEFNIDRVASAVASHESREPPELENLEDRIVVHSLYDADKLVWGPELTLHRAWEIAEGLGIPFDDAIKKAPNQLESVDNVRKSFRTPLGRKIGPKLVELGVKAGKKLVQDVGRKKK